MFTPDDYTAARETANAFNQARGGELLRVIDPPAQLIPVERLRQLAREAPGDYLAVNAFQAITGRKATHAEAIKLGQLLGHLSVARKKSGPSTFWRLDKAFAERAQ